MTLTLPIPPFMALGLFANDRCTVMCTYTLPCVFVLMIRRILGCLFRILVVPIYVFVCRFLLFT